MARVCTWADRVVQPRTMHSYTPVGMRHRMRWTRLGQVRRHRCFLSALSHHEQGVYRCARRLLTGASLHA